MRIYFIRHAETDSNLKKIIQGTLDTDLNDSGHHQAQLLAKAYSHLNPTHIFCSDLKRCRQTLSYLIAAIKEHGPCVDVEYTDLLRERYMAELQGISKEEVEELCISRGLTKFEFGETPAELTARVSEFWDSLVVPAIDEGGNIIICSHGGTLLFLLRTLVRDYGYQGTITRSSGNTGVTIIEGDEVVQYADISHLTPEEKEEAEMENVDV